MLLKLKFSVTFLAWCHYSNTFTLHFNMKTNTVLDSLLLCKSQFKCCLLHMQDITYQCKRSQQLKTNFRSNTNVLLVQLWLLIETQTLNGRKQCTITCVSDECKCQLWGGSCILCVRNEGGSCVLYIKEEGGGHVFCSGSEHKSSRPPLVINNDRSLSEGDCLNLRWHYSQWRPNFMSQTIWTDTLTKRLI